MAATFNFCEDNGASTGSPAHGTTRSGFGADTHFATDVNWKNIDDCTANSGTVYSSAPIVAGNNSFTKYQYGHFTGTFNQILNGLWSAHTAGSLGAGLTLHGKVQSSYTTPATTTDSGMSSPTDFTSVVAIGSGLAVNFSTTGPEAASPTSTLSAAGYTQYLASQMQTTTSAVAGDTATVTTTLRYDEN
jgi:hypothetical protein